MKIFTDRYWMILSKLEFHFNVSRVEKKKKTLIISGLKKC